ncbi:protein-tyrosine phosphatase [Candidatus Scalindua japonica]|uniref:Protein-tyrosine phosphatase n=1 Tax=Candidatus Scalindua japonica TaxID=1284222 RepID=A0A286U2D3_9BACT|nr:dual specificity protein phosphatase 23 [Candidatus Scalindua japonica]GAX62286.1 protein-tyrosine phosphatase [Candidatus Scalindua japonica]
MIRNFSWLIEGEIAGMGKPASSVNDFEFLKGKGVEAIVTLTEYPLSEVLIEEFGFNVKHIPVKDFEAPALEQIEDFVTFAVDQLSKHKRLVVHCEAGIGRTGTMLACYLVSQGYSALDAIEEVRARRPGSIETIEQEEVVLMYERK